jgi:hypothetical protein
VPIEGSKDSLGFFWEKLCKGEAYGGLGWVLGRCLVLAKQGWRLLKNPSFQIAPVLKQIFSFNQFCI